MLNPHFSPILVEMRVNGYFIPFPEELITFS